MVTLPGIEEYSADQLNDARILSPAWARYERLLSQGSGHLLSPHHERRHRAWIECVLATYFTTATTAQICSYWSQVADSLLTESWCQEGLDPEEALLIALGKHGAEELNLSSDIDLIVVADPKHAFQVEKKIRHIHQKLQTSGENGFCFRLDFDLRPGGSMGPLVTSPAQFQDHYWSQGETWERLALVRLRPLIGSKSLAQQVRDLARRFSFRRFLDYTLLDDLKSLRSMVHQKGFDRRDQEIHLKLEVGGIRDIELFTHSLLVLNGGKVPELQTHSTSTALKRLADRNLLPPQEALELNEIYWRLRHLENLVQSVDDRQTHSLSTNLAAHLGVRSEVVKQDMNRVDQIVSSLLGQVNLEVVHLPAENLQGEWLRGLGFSDETIANVWAQLIQATALSHKNARDEKARQEFLFLFVKELARHRGHGSDPDLGLSILLDFVKAARGKATFFTMLLRSPRLLEDLARLFCLSPYLGSLLASRPELLDHFILQLDEAWSKDTQTLLQQMSERKLLTEIWSANQFLAEGDLTTLFERITQTADDISKELLLHLHQEYPDSNVGIIALGKWGGGELGLRSDLDFIFVTPNDPIEDDFKVARRFISRITYEVDLRLRPSGQSGPLLISQNRLANYWRTEAKPWERQAYLRARPLLLYPEQAPIEKSWLVQRTLTKGDLGELRVIRSKLLHDIDVENKVADLKFAPGGLVDIEFVVQTALLQFEMDCPATSTIGMLQALQDRSPIWQSCAGELSKTYLLLRTFEQMLQLASAHKVGQFATNQISFQKAAALRGLSSEEAWDQLLSALKHSRSLLNKVDPTGLKIEL